MLTGALALAPPTGREAMALMACVRVESLIMVNCCAFSPARSVPTFQINFRMNVLFILIYWLLVRYGYPDGRAAKKENRAANENGLQKCKTATKGWLQKCKKFFLEEKYFLFRCQMTCCAGSRVRLCKTGTKQFESGKIWSVDNIGTVFAANKSA